MAAKRGMNGGPLGEALKLTLGCLKEGFNFYQHLGYDFLAETQLSQFVCNLLTELAFVAPFFLSTSGPTAAELTVMQTIRTNTNKAKAKYMH